MAEKMSIQNTAPSWFKKARRPRASYGQPNFPLIPAKAGTQNRRRTQDLDFFTYILASRRNGTLYTGSTDSLLVRVSEHRSKTFSGFTARYGVDILVWFERHPTRDAAFRRERQIKKWNRAWKLRLIEEGNPDWKDLAEDLRLGDLKDAHDWTPPAEDLGPRLRGDERDED